MARCERSASPDGCCTATTTPRFSSPRRRARAANGSSTTGPSSRSPIRERPTPSNGCPNGNLGDPPKSGVHNVSPSRPFPRAPVSAGQRPASSRVRERCSGHLGLAAQDVEFVALGVGEHDPTGAVGVSAVVDLRGAKCQEPGELLVPGSLPGSEVEVDAVLDLLGFGDLDEEQPVPPISREDEALLVAGGVRVVGVGGVVEDGGSPLGECKCVAAVDCRVGNVGDHAAHRVMRSGGLCDWRMSWFRPSSERLAARHRSWWRLPGSRRDQHAAATVRAHPRHDRRPRMGLTRSAIPPRRRGRYGHDHE
jgi:hypothetical protein